MIIPSLLLSFLAIMFILIISIVHKINEHELVLSIRSAMYHQGRYDLIDTTPMGWTLLAVPSCLYRHHLHTPKFVYLNFNWLKHSNALQFNVWQA